MPIQTKELRKKKLDGGGQNWSPERGLVAIPRLLPRLLKAAFKCPHFLAETSDLYFSWPNNTSV